MEGWVVVRGAALVGLTAELLHRFRSIIAQDLPRMEIPASTRKQACSHDAGLV